MPDHAIGAGAAISFLISAEVVYAVVAAACSSPQTCEINAGKRADTLMKWVHLGLIQAGIFVFIGAYIAERTGGSAWATILGGLLAAGLMYASYLHAKKAGLKNKGPGTES